MSSVRPPCSVYDFSVQAIDGSTQPLAAFAGQVLLVVNVASQCGFTPQYAALEGLWREFRDRGFAVLAFPCNQFGGQEPGTDAQIREFCSLRYGVSFPLFAKGDVNGAHAHPLFRYLKHALPGVAGSESIKWNFTKFLVDRRGRPVRRFGSVVSPAHMRGHVQSLLDAAP